MKKKKKEQGESVDQLEGDIHVLRRDQHNTPFEELKLCKVNTKVNLRLKETLKTLTLRCKKQHD